MTEARRIGDTAADLVSAHLAPSSRPGTVRERTWRVGTLTYSFAGLAAVFAWLLFGDLGSSIKERSTGTIVAAGVLANRLMIPCGAAVRIASSTRPGAINMV